MKKTIYIAIILFISTALFSHSDSNTQYKISYSDSLKLHINTSAISNITPIIIDKLELPKFSPSDDIIHHIAYTLSYNETHEQANWVAYELTSAETQKAFERTNKFKPDPLVKTFSANSSDYAESGYDRGHLAPASDMGWSATAMAESFYYSNMSPQVPGFNRGIWKKMEELVRTWAVDNNNIYITTGPILTPGLSAIGPDKVSVPNYYYKVILDYTLPSIKGIGFIIANAASHEPLQSFAVTIDSVEKLTGIDFFSQLPDAQETIIEQTVCVDCWTWSVANTKSVKRTDKNGNASSGAMQCNGLNKTGARCRNTTTNPSGYCYLHQPQSSEPIQKEKFSVQCSGTTKKGTRCKHMTYSPNGLCFQHGGN